MKPTTLLLSIAFVLFGSQALADDVYVCTNGADERIISVTYAYADQPVPCEVTYEKSTGIQTLWNANNQADYCETKAFEFVEKQRSWGWDCLMTE